MEISEMTEKDIQIINDAAIEDAIQVIKALISKNPAITFRGIFLETGLPPQIIWESLKILRASQDIETTKISNKRGYGYKLQLQKQSVVIVAL